MKPSWQLQEAKARLSEVVRAAQQEGPQQISLRGEPAVVVLSIRDFDRLVRPARKFVEFIHCSPLAGTRLQLRRDPSLTRDVKL